MAKKLIYTRGCIGGVSPAYLADEREVFESVKYLPQISYKNACRYQNLRTIEDPDTNKIVHESYNQKVIKRQPTDSYFTVTLEEVDRLDIVANKVYGVARYWWVIAMANYLLDPFDVPVGTQLRIPTIMSLYQNGGVLSGN